MLSQHTPTAENQQEEWFPVVGYEEAYEVSDHGRVRRIGGGSGSTHGRVIGVMFTHNGYHRVTLSMHGKAKIFFLHRVVAAAILGPRPDGMQVNHKDGDKLNNRVANLEYLTPSENTLHAMQHGLCSIVRADPDMVRAIRQSSESDQVLARRFGIANGTVWAIRAGITWRHVE